MRNYYFDVFLKKSCFWRGTGHGRHASAKGSGASRADQKAGPLSGPFWLTLSQKMF